MSCSSPVRPVWPADGRSCRLSPHAQLGFARPLTELVTRPLIISNPNKFPIAFKIKTTAPKQYCVKPNQGRVEAGSRTEVAIMLQPMKEEPPLNAKCRDKFLVQSVQIVSELASVPYGEFWSLVERQSKDSIREQKIRVAYLPPTSAALLEEEEADTTSGAVSSRNGAAATPAKPLTYAELQVENTKLRQQVGTKSKIPRVPLHYVLLLLIVVAVAVAFGTWFAVGNSS